MTAIIKGSRSITEILQFTTFQDWAMDNIPYVKAHRDKGGPGVDHYELNFGFRKIHISQLARGRYKFVLREPDDDFLIVDREVGGDVSGFMSWPSTKKGLIKPYARLSYVVDNGDDREAMETFLEDYFTHCEDAETKFERACFNTNSSWAKKQC